MIDADDLVSEAAGDVRPQRLAEAIRIVAIRLLGHLHDRRQIAVDRSVAHDGGRARVVRSEREILGHPFHEPERRIDLRELRDAAAGASAREDVELELVRHFVREHVLEPAEVAGEGHEHAMTQRLGHTAGALAQIAGDVVLSEVGARGEEEDRLLLAELVPQNARKPSVVALGHARAFHRGNALGGVVVDEEVLGLDDLPVEVLVLDLVLAEVLLACRPRGERPKCCERDERRAPYHA